DRAFDLTCDLMLRAQLIKLDEQEHILNVTMHHIASDGWSIDVMTRELSALYQSCLEARVNGLLAPALDPLPVRYIDYARWQRESLTSQRIEGLLGYWREELRGVPALELPTDRPRPAQASYRGYSVPLSIDQDIIGKLESLAQGNHATLQMVLLAAFETLLYRYTQQEDFAVGVPFAGRDDAQLEGLIGFFVSTFVVRADMSGEPTFEELVRRVRQKSLDAYAHQELPLQVLLADLQPERHLSRPPVFQVMFQLLNRLDAGLNLTGLEVVEQGSCGNRVKFDLELHLIRHQGEVSGTLEFSTDLFDLTSVERMAGHYVRLLESIVADPNQKVGQLSLLGEKEQTQLLVDFNQTACDYPREACVHELFEQQVERTPDAVALVFEDQQLTYRELNERSNRLARYLRARGVTSQTPVGLSVERSLDLVVSILGIFKAGGTYVPLDPEYPKERTLHMLQISKVYLILTERSRIENFQDFSIEFSFVDDVECGADESSNLNLLNETSSQSTAYVIFTSGSTGIPKGVAIAHQSAVNLLTWASKVLYKSGATRLVGVAPATFDISVAELLSPLMMGGTTILVSRNSTRDIDKLISVIARLKDCVVQATPATWSSILECDWSAQGCITAITTGEALSSQLRDKLVRLGIRILDLYGPTETTIWSTYHEVTEFDHGGCIGRPINNTQVYVLDFNREMLPLGVAGELYIGGDGLAQGYLGRPDLTAERFVQNPFSKDSKSKLYRTGDLCRWRNDGTLEYLGRIDHQVKLRGFRIELGEIESVLASHAEIGQCVVILREDRPGDKKLVAYFTSGQGQAPSPEQLRSHVGAALPDYMIPAAYVHLDALPLTPSGKVDRRGLPAPDLKDVHTQEQYTAPRNDIESQLAQ
ncbi:MAG: hypothetical protein RL069_1436, partial [Planctomycetota bacterium]